MIVALPLKSLGGLHAHDRLVEVCRELSVVAAHIPGRGENLLLKAQAGQRQERHNGYHSYREVRGHDNHCDEGTAHHRSPPREVQKTPGQDIRKSFAI